jgi:NAD(P)-dependent dehydrogenase (short-subunit alcohol dehydrogenase family)
VATVPSTQRVAVVTGAARGIGRACAVALAREGYSMVLAGRDRKSLSAVADEIGASAGTAMAVECDVKDEDQVMRLFGEVRSNFGRLDLLFNNAGISTSPVPLEMLTLVDWSAVVATNLTGVFLCTREAFALMKEQDPGGGRIINNGSIAAHSPRPNSIAYTATKHAVTGITKSTSLEGRRYGIACGQIDIGNAATDLTRGLVDRAEQADGVMRPEPTMDVTDVARAVVFMASLPLEANVQFITVMATTMPLIGRG